MVNNQTVIEHLKPQSSHIGYRMEKIEIRLINNGI